ncbi:MAG TPA: histidine kinase [Euzebyales bacterium]
MQHGRLRVAPRVVDALVITAVALPGIVGLAILIIATRAAPSDIPLTSVVLMVLQAGVLWWRRTHPLVVFAVTLLALLTAEGLGDINASSFLGPPAAAYALGAHGSRRTAIAGLVGLAAAAVVSAAVAAAAQADAIVMGPMGALTAVAWGVGRYVRMRRDYVDTLVAYAAQVEADRDEKARRAVLEERRRIARELHDQVAHHLGIAALHTSAARRWLARDTDRAESSLGLAEDAVRGALTTMPAILRALRVDDADGDLAPQPTLDGLDRLVAEVAEAGLAVELRIEGERRALSSPVALAAYRIVQEALTNTLKHADATRSTVVLRFAPDRLDVVVTDNGSGAVAEGAAGGGLGLLGMRERVDVLGGTLMTSPGQGGFAVRATLPLVGGKERGDDPGAAGR